PGPRDLEVLRVDQAHVIRHKVLVEGQSVRSVAREMGISRNTVRRYVEGAAPGERVPAAKRVLPEFERVRGRIDAILADAPRWTGGKQRLTAARLHELLLTGSERELSARFVALSGHYLFE